jgi:hypothetical protein
MFIPRTPHEFQRKIRKFFLRFLKVWMTAPGRPTLEEEKRRELVLQTLAACGVDKFDPDVIETLTRWLAQESKAAIQDKRSDLVSREIPTESVSELILASLGLSNT